MKELIRVQHLSSLHGEQTRFFRPHPQPLSHAVGEGSRAFPLSRLAGEGDKGGEGKKARLPVHARAGKIAPAAAILCRTDVPLPDLKEGGFTLTYSSNYGCVIGIRDRLAFLLLRHPTH